MKVAVSATGASLDDRVDPRFGRCQCFIVADVDTTAFEALPNTSADAMSGAGIEAAQAVARRGVQAVITGQVGPNAYQVLSAAGIGIYTGASGTVREAIGKLKRGELSEAAGPGPAGPGMGAGMGMGRGMGRGGGMGRGMGRGGGMGRGMATGGRQSAPPAQVPFGEIAMGSPPMSREQEMSILESQMENLQLELERVRRRLSELGESPHHK